MTKHAYRDRSEQPVWPPHARAAYLDEPVPYVPAESADKHGDCERCYWKGRAVAAEREVERLKMGLWDVWVALGHDTDGDTGPGAFIAGMGIGGFIRMVIDDATTWRRESEEDYAADTDRLEGRIARAKALLNESDMIWPDPAEWATEGVRVFVERIRAALDGPQ